MVITNRRSKEPIVVKGVLATRINPNTGKRKISLSQDERRAFQKNQMVEKAVALFLDLQSNHTWDEIARELGVSTMTLRDLTKTDEFMLAYDAHFVELGHDPRLRATQQAISDLLPRAMMELRNMLVDPTISAATRLSIIKEVFKYAGIQEPKPARSDKAEMAEFLKDMGVSIENVNVAVMSPPPRRPEFVDGSVSASSDPPEV